MPGPVDGSSPAGDAEVDAGDENVLERQKAARRLAEQSWREFFISLGIRTIVVLVVVLALFWLLKVVLG
jgi:hypothetical protein